MAPLAWHHLRAKIPSPVLDAFYQTVLNYYCSKSAPRTYLSIALPRRAAGNPFKCGLCGEAAHCRSRNERRGQADVPPGAPCEKMRGSACSESRRFSPVLTGRRSPAVWTFAEGKPDPERRLRSAGDRPNSCLIYRRKMVFGGIENEEVCFGCDGFGVCGGKFCAGRARVPKSSARRRTFPAMMWFSSAIRCGADTLPPRFPRSLRRMIFPARQLCRS